jgi:hypothetical protein
MVHIEMTKETKNIKPDYLEFKIINSNAFYVQKVVGVIIGIFAILIGGSVMSRGTGGNFISLFIELPFWLEIVLMIMSFVLVCVSVTMQFNKNSRRGILQLQEKIAHVDERNLVLTDKKIEIKLNTLKEKSIYKRKFIEGSNNWLNLTNNDNSISKIEFLIDSREKEDQLLKLADKWKEANKVTINESNTNFWQKWNDF